MKLDSPYQQTSPTHLMSMITGHMLSRVIFSAVELGIIDALGDDGASPTAVAYMCGGDPEAIVRMLHALVAMGLVTESPSGLFTSTALAEPLRSESDVSLKNLVLLLGSERCWQSWAQMHYSVRTGVPASHFLYNMTGLEYFQRDETAAAVFRAATLEVSSQIDNAVVKAHDFTHYSTIVDVGGGDGKLLRRVLQQAVDAKGTLMDTPERLRSAATRFEEAGQSARCEIVTADYFDSIPAGRDAYLLKSVLRDKPDERCIDILTSIGDAMTSSSELVVIESLAPARFTHAHADRQVALRDIEMLVMTGGRVRTLTQFDRMLARASLRRHGDVVELKGAEQYAMLAVRKIAPHRRGRSMPAL